MTTPRIPLWKVLVPVALIIAGAVVGLNAVKHFAGRPGQGSGGAVELREGAVVPDFALKQLAGQELRLSAVKAKVVLLNFWATWCDGCVSEIPSINELRKTYSSKGFEVLAVNVDENPQAVLPGFVNRLKMDYPVYIDINGELSKVFDVHGIPLTVIIAVPSRKILLVQGGERDWNTPEIRGRLESWLAE